jgi:diguanylate cyclase (GGDEF)-like protein
MPNHDAVLFAQEDSTAEASRLRSAKKWNVLIVDDEADVHESTMLAISREEICGRQLAFHHAYSAEEAQALLATSECHFAAILLDVVMESEHAGLNLVRIIREDLNILDARIILRTGQPGYAPELKTISRYQINDYRAKSELTRNKLFTTLTAAIRSYSQIRSLEKNRRGLETIVRASKELLYLRSYHAFSYGILAQISSLFKLSENGFVVIKKADEHVNDAKIIAAIGCLSHYESKSLVNLDDSKVIEAVLNTAEKKESSFFQDKTCLFFVAPNDIEMCVYLPVFIDCKEEELQWLELLSNTIAASIDNLELLEQRHKDAYLDQLVGIPNRLSLLHKIEQALTKKTSNLHVILLDIDNFGPLNDTIGTETGDQLLKLVSSRITVAHKRILIARIAGDTFALFGDIDQFSSESIKQCFNQPFTSSGVAHSLTVTQGRVTIEHQTDAEGVLAQANVALKHAKQTLRGGARDFHADMFVETQRRVNLQQNLRKAFDENQLFMAYQPQINLQTGEIKGFEALMRWKTETGELIPPDQFIPVAESSGLIVCLGEWALRESLSKIGKVREKSGLNLSIAVNVSAVQFAQPGFIDSLRNALDFTRAQPDWLELEITESFAMHDFETVKSLIVEINRLGIQISLDDFGTGFCSLTYLEALNVNSLKIDKSFVHRMSEENFDSRLPETILRLGQNLNLEVIAEGVETAAQAKWFTDKGCQYGQGYLFAKPIDSDDLFTWIETYQKKL